jgi:hypothetical protein
LHFCGTHDLFLHPGPHSFGIPLIFCSRISMSMRPIWILQCVTHIFSSNITTLEQSFLSQAGKANWVQNTDGSDTYESKRITYQNWIYQGGDDCIAFKPNSTQIAVRNVSCTSVNGMTFGSVGQYPSSVSNFISSVVAMPKMYLLCSLIFYKTFLSKTSW